MPSAEHVPLAVGRLERAGYRHEAARRFGGDRRAYTEAKDDFVERVLARRPGCGAG